MNTQKTILVVDDDLVSILLLVRALEKEYRVITAESGAEALKLAKTEQPDLVILDFMLPDINGLEVCKQLKQIEETSSIPVVFVTCNLCTLDEECGLELGAVDYIFKPIQLNITLLRIRNQIALKLHSELLEYLTNELVEKNLQLESVNRQDGLTGVANRRWFDEVIINEINRSCRDQTPLSLMISDIDKFKNFNDIHGHLSGDECLKAVAKEFRKVFQRSSDVIARYGGDEFVIILPNTPSSMALQMAEELKSNVEQIVLLTDIDEEVSCPTVSIGGTTVIATSDLCDKELISIADAALYESKCKGRNQITWH